MTMQVLGTLSTIFSHVDGWLAGARMRYNYQVDRLVLGAELAGSITGMKDNGASYVDLGFGGGLPSYCEANVNVN